MAIVDYYNTDDDFNFLCGDFRWDAQVFTTSKSYSIISVNLLLQRAFELASPGTITAGIYTVDVDDKPTGSALCSGTTNGETLGYSAPEWREIVFSVPYALTNSTKYAIVISCGGTIGDLIWRADSSSPSYAGGGLMFSNNSGSTWGDSLYATYDLMFETYEASASSTTSTSTTSTTSTTATASTTSSTTSTTSTTATGSTTTTSSTTSTTTTSSSTSTTSSSTSSSTSTTSSTSSTTSSTSTTTSTTTTSGGETNLEVQEGDYDITTQETIMTYTNSSTEVLFCQGMIYIGDGNKDLTGEGGEFEFTLQFGSQVNQPDPQLITFSTNLRASVFTEQFPLYVGETVYMKIKSPNSGDTDVHIQASILEIGLQLLSESIQSLIDRMSTIHYVDGDCGGGGSSGGGSVSSGSTGVYVARC